MSGEAKRMTAERLAGYRNADPSNLDARRTRDELIGHIDAVEAELKDAALAVESYMSVAADHSDWIDKVEKERDEALARVAQLSGGSAVPMK